MAGGIKTLWDGKLGGGEKNAALRHWRKKRLFEKGEKKKKGHL